MIDWNKEVGKLLEIEKSTFHRLEKLECFQKVDEQTILLNAYTNTNRLVYIQLNIYADDVVHLRCSTEPIENSSSLMVVKDNWQGCRYSVSDEENFLVISTSELQIIIEKNPWKFKITNIQGYELFVEDRKDTHTFSSQEDPTFMTYPFGFVEDDRGTRFTGAFSILPDEGFYGFGEKFTSINKRGQILTSFNKFSITCEEGCNKCVPFFMSSRGYGLFFHSLYPQLFDVGVKSGSTCSFAVADKLLDIYFINGPSFKRILGTYTDITGKPQLPPKWSFGIWMSRCCYWSRKELEAVAKEMRENRLPCDVLRLDPSWFHHYPDIKSGFVDFFSEWDEEVFPNPEEMLAGLKEIGIKVCLWIHHSFSFHSPAYKEALERGYNVENDDNPRTCMIDLSNPLAFEWYKGKLKELIQQGASSFFLDWGMESSVYAGYENLKGLEARNGYSILYAKAAYEAIEECTGEPGALWGLSGFAGTHRYPATGGGDARSTYQDMANTLRGGLSAALSGFAFWGCDIGGFGVYPESKRPDTRLYTRHLQNGVFMPYCNIHGAGEREPWFYGVEFTNLYRKYAELRYRLMPYIYSAAYSAHCTGLPMMRPMILEYQDDPTVKNLDLQYMFGDCFLVAPVFDEGVTRTLYLPAGEWIDYWSKKIYTGPMWITVAAPVDTLPLFVKAGSIIPLGPADNYVQDRLLDELYLEVYPLDGVFAATLYDDNCAYNIDGESNGSNMYIHIDKPDTYCHIEFYNVPCPVTVITNSNKKLSKLNVTLFDSEYEGWIYSNELQVLSIKMKTGSTEEKISITF